MQSKFNPTLSFDGVAIIVGCVTLAAWMGSLKQKVEHLETAVQQEEQVQRALADAQKLTTINLATLQQLVIDKTDKNK